MTDSGYTPSMQAIREAFAVWHVTDETAATRRAQFDSALAAHDAEVRADQIRKDAEIIEKVLVTENNDEWSMGVDWALAHGAFAIRDQIGESK